METTSVSYTTLPLKSTNTKTTVEARELGGVVTFQYEMPVDSASDTYGGNIGLDKYALCGARSHFLKLNNRIINPDDFHSQKYVDPWLEVEYFPEGDPNTVSDVAYY